MGSRTINVVVVVFWIATMSWLVGDKVMPLLRVGEPPNYRSILADDTPQPPVCWLIDWNGTPLGWAASNVVRRDDGMSEMHSRVFFGQLPLDEIAPGWLGAFVRPVLRDGNSLDMDAKSRLEIDPLGRLVGFESKVRLAKIRDAIRMQGRIDGTQLKLNVQSGEFVYRTEKFLPQNALVGDALSPQAQLPGLRVGQTWTMPVYSPFRPPNSPLEILQASVESSELIVWNGEPVNTKLVVYRTDSGSGLMANHEARGKLWVQADGTVLKQEITVFNSRLHFVRLSAQQGRVLSEALGEDDWARDLTPEHSQYLLGQISRDASEDMPADAEPGLSQRNDDR